MAADEQQEWTRATTHRVAAAPDVRLLNPADAAVAQAWRPHAVDPSPEPAQIVEPPHATARPALRPVPVLPARDTDRHTAATPVFAPSRDEDVALHRTVPTRRSYPTPSPTPWRVEALQAPVEEMSRSPFPSLPDEVPAGVAAAPRAAIAAARRSDGWRPSPRNDTSGAWPVLPGTRIPALRPSLTADDHASSHWPELMDGASEERDDEGLALPDGHRERLAREQRGLSWNG